MNDVNSDCFFEQVSSDSKPSIRIVGLSKAFRNGFEMKTVVDNLHLDFYQDQITGFLVHNGAGKTTVTFILCGMYEPTSGTAFMLSQDIRTSMDNIRTSIGFCPQKSILFDDLSVRQHLDLVASVNLSYNFLLNIKFIERKFQSSKDDNLFLLFFLNR